MGGEPAPGGEGTSHVLLSPVTIQSGLAGCVAPSPQCSGIPGDAPRARHAFRQQSGWVEAPLPEPFRVKGDGHQELRRRVEEGFRQFPHPIADHCPRTGVAARQALPRVLEVVDPAKRIPLEPDGCLAGDQGGGLATAACTQVPRLRGASLLTACAGICRDLPETRVTRGTECSAIRRCSPAAGTGMGEQEIQELEEKRGQGLPPWTGNSG